MVFEKTLTDLVSGIRSHKRDTALFISQNIAEIKTELQSSDFYTKSNALQKLTFLQMMGYSMSYAAFAAVEVMSSPRFALKRVGYLAACQGLDQPDKSPVVLLTTNLLKKEMRGATVGSGDNVYHAGLAVNCLSNIATEDLGRELLPDLLNLLKHPSPYSRKKALLCLYKVFLKYPQGLRLSFDQIKLCLDDPNPSVVSCAVNVITELSDKNPKNYLPLAPSFFRLLTSSANNWMLIKVVKLLGSLIPEEPRLARKLLDPLSSIVRSTHAKSLLYEAVYALTLCLQYLQKAPANLDEVVELSVTTLRDFVSDSDQNLKYLGLVGFGSLLQSQPDILHNHSECRGLILKCLSDEDVTIRTRALGLLRFMTTRRNLVDLVTQLLGHVEAASGQYRTDLVEEIIKLCSGSKYELIADFDWYFDVLVILAGVRGLEEGQGDAIAGQWTDVAWRVLPVRAYAVRRSLEVLVCRGPGRNGSDDSAERHIAPQVLPAAAWIVGEYSTLLPEALREEGLDTMYDQTSKGVYHSLVQSMTSPHDAAGVDPLPNTTLAVFVQNAMKVFAAASASACGDDELAACATVLTSNLAVHSESVDVEVRERAFTSLQLLASIGLPTGVSDASSVASKSRSASATLTYLLIPEQMKPISAKAQKRKYAEGPPSPVTVQDLERDIDWEVFDFLNEETPWLDAQGNVRGSVEIISFTEQKQTAASRPVIRQDNSTGLGQSIADYTEKSALGGIDSGLGSAATPTSTNQNREGDPFYLSSAPATSAKPADPFGALTNAAADGATKEGDTSRFGSINLDSGDEADGGGSARRRKKPKKKKSKKPGAAAIAKGQVLVFEDDDDNHSPAGPKPMSNVEKEFENLALVDLTTPLGEDEVMPVNQHYVVPERSARAATSKNEKKAKKDKKKKSKKKSSSSQAGREESPFGVAPSGGGAAEGDLLGFDFGAPTAPGTGDAFEAGPVKATASTMEMPMNANPINSAFDDLLGLDMASPPQVSTASLPNASPREILSSSTLPPTKAEVFVGDMKAKKKKKKKKKKSEK